MRQRIDPSWKGAFATEVELSAEGLRVRREREELHRMLDEQVAALNRELAQSGIAFKDVDELVNTALPYPAAIPILLKHMTMPYHENIGEMIARALAVPEARYAWDFIVDEYKRAPDLRPDGIKSYRKDALALAVAGAMPPDRWDEFLEIIRDKSNGRSRSLMLEKFYKSKREDRDELLDELSKDSALTAGIGDIRKRQARALKQRQMGQARKNLQ